jgi:gas vesicle protein
MSDDRSIDVLVAFGVGLVAGAAAALLLAPASGEETRKRIGEGAREAGDKIRDRSAELGDKIRTQSRDVSERLVETSREASGKIREQADQIVGEVKSQADRVGHAFEEGKRAYQKGGK